MKRIRYCGIKNGNTRFCVWVFSGIEWYITLFVGEVVGFFFIYLVVLVLIFVSMGCYFRCYWGEIRGFNV